MVRDNIVSGELAHDRVLAGTRCFDLVVDRTLRALHDRGGAALPLGADRIGLTLSLRTTPGGMQRALAACVGALRLGRSAQLVHLAPRRLVLGLEPSRCTRAACEALPPPA